MDDYMDAPESELRMESELTDEARGYLLETTKWARFLAIVSFVLLGLVAVMVIGMSTFFSQATSAAGMPFSGAFIVIFYLIFLGIAFIPNLFLYRFATRTRAGLEAYDSMELTSGFENLKSMYKFTGILMIIVLGLYALGLIFGGLTAVFLA